MKRISAVVRPEKLEPLKEALFEKNVRGMTIYQVHGCGNQHGWKEYFRGSEIFLNMIPKVKFEIVVDDSQVEELVELICSVAPERSAMARSSFPISNASFASVRVKRATPRCDPP